MMAEKISLFKILEIFSFVTITMLSMSNIAEAISSSDLQKVWTSDSSSVAPTEAPTESPTSFYEYETGWLGSMGYAAVAVIALIAAGSIAYYQSHFHPESGDSAEEATAIADESSYLLDKRGARDEVVV